MWDVVMPESPGRYSATGAPLVVGDLVISGIAGGDGPLRGFLAAYKATTGQQVWRFWTVPKRGEPGSETWSSKAIETGGGATWVTGSYDVKSGLLYWTTGNPFPATDGDDRKGLNLYTNCVLALEAKTGKLRWYYQFTPHDLTTGMPPNPFCWWIPSIADATGSCCCRRIGTGSSTSSTGPTVKCFWESLSSGN